MAQIAGRKVHLSQVHVQTRITRQTQRTLFDGFDGKYHTDGRIIPKIRPFPTKVIAIVASAQQAE